LPQSIEAFAVGPQHGRVTVMGAFVLHCHSFPFECQVYPGDEPALVEDLDLRRRVQASQHEHDPGPGLGARFGALVRKCQGLAG